MEASTNSDLALLATSGIRRFNALAAKVDGCVRLTLGEPEFPTPAPVCEAVTRSLAKGQTHYPPNNGRPDLLEALSAYMRRHGLGYGPEELVVTCGATEALSATLMAILDPGDEVVVPTPAFGLYETIVRAAHGRVATLDTSCSGFQIRERDLRGVVGPKTRAIVITSPNNPTGCVLDSESLDAVAGVAAERGLVVVCDDVYNRLCYEEGYERFAPRHPELRDQTVVVDSFSKPWAMTGWRLGWLAAAPALKSQIQKMHQYLVSSVPSFLQEAAVVALGCDVEPMRQNLSPQARLRGRSPGADGAVGPEACGRLLRLSGRAQPWDGLRGALRAPHSGGGRRVRAWHLLWGRGLHETVLLRGRRRS